MNYVLSILRVITNNHKADLNQWNNNLDCSISQTKYMNSNFNINRIEFKLSTVRNLSSVAQYFNK